MRNTEEQRYREFVSGRLTGLRRSAYLLCGDPHLADDLVSTAIGKLYRGWARIGRLESIDAYVRRMLINAWMDELRRPWRRERVTDRLPEPPPVAGPDIADQLALWELLAKLPPRCRAVLVLRYLDDHSIEQTAEILGLSTGTVKSHTSRGLVALRGLIGESGLVETVGDKR